jgi:hypothetical protein
MLITCKACAAVNFIQSKLVKRGEAHCTICRKLIDISASQDEQTPAAFRSKSPPPLPPPSIHDLLAESVAKVPIAQMWGKNDDGKTSPDPLMLGELERKLEKLNSKQRLAINAPTFLSESPDVMDVIIEDEEEEELDMSPSIKLPTMDLSRWNAATIPSIPANNARSRLNQRLTVAAWMFVVGLGTAGVAGAAVAHTNASNENEKKNAANLPTATATALLAQHASSMPPAPKR